MRLFLLIVFIVFPMLEIALLVKLGSALGFWPSFGIVIATGILGSTVLRHQGFAVLRRSQDALAEGHPPIEPVVDGLFLITPGFMSDIIGVLLLVPPIRKTVARWSLRKVLTSGSFQGGVFTQTRETRWSRTGPDPRSAADPQASRRPRPDISDAPIIEGEFERLDETTVPPRQNRPKPPGE
jgi:UPF0716 protein FxsA